MRPLRDYQGNTVEMAAGMTISYNGFGIYLFDEQGIPILWETDNKWLMPFLGDPEHFYRFMELLADSHHLGFEKTRPGTEFLSCQLTRRSNPGRKLIEAGVVIFYNKEDHSFGLRGNNGKPVYWRGKTQLKAPFITSLEHFVDVAGCLAASHNLWMQPLVSQPPETVLYFQFVPFGGFKKPKLVKPKRRRKKKQ